MAESRPNILWITLESVRQDHTSLGEDERGTTPNIERIATSTDGIALQNCFAHARWTPASTASMLTGTHLTTHRVGYESDEVHQLPRELDTVPELLRTQGYRTGGLSSNSYLSSATGLDRGFDRFLWPDRYDALRNPTSVLRFLLKPERHRNLPMAAKQLNLTYELLTDVAKRWTEAFRGTGDPFFLYLHYNTPHHPYRPPHGILDERLQGTGLTPTEAIQTARNVTENMWEVMANGCDLTDRERTSLQATYDAAIAYVDRLVGDLVDDVLSSGRGDTVIVITGDHGELFGEQGVLGHNLVLDDGLLNVPMVVHGFDDLTHTVGSQDLVQHIDVMQTLVTATGCSTSQFQGIDLRKDTRDAVLAQRGPRPGDIDRLLENNPQFEADRFHTGLLDAIRTDSFKYVESDEGAELYRLPDETTDVSKDHPAENDRLAARLNEYRSERSGHPEDRQRADFSDAMRAQLKDMGYI